MPRLRATIIIAATYEVKTKNDLPLEAIVASEEDRIRDELEHEVNKLVGFARRGNGTITWEVKPERAK